MPYFTVMRVNIVEKKKSTLVYRIVKTAVFLVTVTYTKQLINTDCFIRKDKETLNEHNTKTFLKTVSSLQIHS